MRSLTPSDIPAPLARYSHGLEIPAGARLAFCSGQLGIAADGAVPDDAGEQARLCFRAIARILGEAGMGLADLVRLNAYVTSPDHLQAYMRVRDEFVGAPPPASTLMIVSGFSRPEFKVEIEAIAARAP
jgi:enamine deaminase RidA (YjgF/YER057c/UK114 family)